MNDRLHNVKISVLIPCYNSSKTIEDTLRSVLSQRVPPAEILVMDDGSTDNTAEIIRSFGSAVTFFQQQNQGVSAARNFLIGQASGDLIALLDHDDLWHPAYLENQMKAFQENPHASVLFTDFIDIPAGRSTLPNSTLPGQIKRTHFKPAEFLIFYNQTSGYILPSFCVFPKRVFDEMGRDVLPIELNGSDDVFLWYYLALLGPFIRTHVTLGGYRLVDTSLSSERVMMYGERVKAMEKVVELYVEKNAPELLLSIARKFLSDSHRRRGVYQMGSSGAAQARYSFRKSLHVGFNMKSLLLLLSTYLPVMVQPKWPNRWRGEEE